MVFLWFFGGSALTYMFPLALFLGGGGVVLGSTFNTPGGGWLTVLIGCIGAKTTYGMGGGLGVVR